MQQFMDMVSGVKAYSISDNMRQGIIKRIFEKECHRYYSRNNDYSNFSMNLDDIVSIFWTTVFKKLPEAKTTGTTVETRGVNGVTSNQLRATNCNPINWLKNHGIMGVRNSVNKVYNRNLLQVCDDCGHRSKADSREIEALKDCPQCASKDTFEFWPNGSSTYKATKERQCRQCKSIWKRKFTYVCAECLSVNVHIESRFDGKEDGIYEVANDDLTVEEQYVAQELEAEVRTIIGGTYGALPINPDPNASPTDTKARAILDVLFDPVVSKDICAKCVKKASLVCSEKCGQPGCAHEKVKNPKETCGAESFSLESCINYSKKIGEYHGVSATLSSRRLKTIRKYFVKYVSENRHIDLCDSLYSLLKRQGKLLVY